MCERMSPHTNARALVAGCVCICVRVRSSRAWSPTPRTDSPAARNLCLLNLLIPPLFSPRRRRPAGPGDRLGLGSQVAREDHRVLPLRRAYVATGRAGRSSSRYCIVSNDTVHVMGSVLAQVQWLKSPARPTGVIFFKPKNMQILFREGVLKGDDLALYAIMSWWIQGFPLMEKI